MKNMKIKAGVLVASMLGFVGSAAAELPVEATAAITSIQTDGQALIAAFWPVIGGITVAFVIYRLFKRGAGKV